MKLAGTYHAWYKILSIKHTHKKASIDVFNIADRSAKEAQLRRAINSKNTSLKSINICLVKG